MENCEYNDTFRIITGIIKNCDEICVENATVMLSVLVGCVCCGNKMIKKIGYTTTNEDGVYLFNIDISQYKNMDFVLEVFNPLQKI